MTTGEHETLHELAALYALDALDGDDLRAFEQHLRECSDCRGQVDELREAAAAFALAADPVEPPAELRERILSDARRGGAVIPFPIRGRLVPVLAAAAAAVGVIVLGIWATSLSRSLDRERDARAAERAALAVAADPSARRIPIGGKDRGTLYVTTSGRAALTMATANPPPKGKTYEAWVFVGATPRRAGTFEGRATVLSRTVTRGTKVAVTVEPDGGVDSPTGPVIMQASA